VLVFVQQCMLHVCLLILRHPLGPGVCCHHFCNVFGPPVSKCDTPFPSDCNPVEGVAALLLDRLQVLRTYDSHARSHMAAKCCCVLCTAAAHVVILLKVRATMHK
jgi:hypothetical protein